MTSILVARHGDVIFPDKGDNAKNSVLEHE